MQDNENWWHWFVFVGDFVEGVEKVIGVENM